MPSSSFSMLPWRYVPCWLIRLSTAVTETSCLPLPLSPSTSTEASFTALSQPSALARSRWAADAIRVALASSSSLNAMAPLCTARPSRHGRRRARTRSFSVQLVPPIDALWCGEQGSASVVAGDFAGGEKSRVRASPSRCSHCRVGPHCQWRFDLEMEIFLFQKLMNSVSFCLFCVDLNRAPKIMKIFVWPLWDVNYLGKILNITF